MKDDPHSQAMRELARLPSVYENVEKTHFDAQTKARRAPRDRQNAALEMRMRALREGYDARRS